MMSHEAFVGFFLIALGVLAWVLKDGMRVAKIRLLTVILIVAAVIAIKSLGPAGVGVG
jgi:hypothetical protein